MKGFVKMCKALIGNKFFENFIMLIIVGNSAFIGVQTTYSNSYIELFQQVALIIFTAEIVIRFTGRESMKEYFTNGWNVFDIVLVGFAYIPESLFANASLVVALRVLRVFRVLRLLKAFPEVRLIVSVLTRSFSALTFNAIFFMIFLYLFSIIGMTLFSLPKMETATPEMQAKITQYMEIAPHAPECSADPYGSLSESWFTLFRILTGDDWTDLRYNLVVASEMGILSISPTLITTFHVIWFIMSSFLLLNLLVGAILNNYQVIMDEQKEMALAEKKRQEEAMAENKLAVEKVSVQ